ncbi:MAG TPA: sulfatase-like hydrolase/transferase, partial [Thermoanaerobaculia bacterium]|nr:sulfatase-like hydrolase/transferase [Thermoanaerobaculia bacterium]
GRQFAFAYATVPQTLPSHASMLTGLYPAGHGVHENARFFASSQRLVAQRLHEAGYHTAAFVSAFALARRFGLSRGFEVYDDEFGGQRAERPAKETTDLAIGYLNSAAEDGRRSTPLFLWVHYYDPHYPYTPPEPFRSQYANDPYYGEVAYMDEQLGRLVNAFETHVSGPKAMILAGDHGEGLGDHGEQQHGNLLYQATMHVPLLLLGPGVTPGMTHRPVSTRRVFHTILDWAGIDATNSLRAAQHEVIAAEAMKPFLDYGWQPQVMAVEGNQKAIVAGRLEVYDVVADPGETRNLAKTASLSRETRATLRDYPRPSLQAQQPMSTDLDAEARRKLASLGYVASNVTPVVRPTAPPPADMTSLFPILDTASGLFVREQYAKAIPLLEEILRKDPYNLDAALRLATSYSSLGRNDEAMAAFERARQIAPASDDVRLYMALHYARGKDWQQAVPLLEHVVATDPTRVPALEALAIVREKQQRIPEAVELRERLYQLRTPSAGELVHLGELQMALGRTVPAIDSFEKVRAVERDAFQQDLDLGVLYLAAGRLQDARDELDRVKPSDPGYAMALFKRAQVAVLLKEADAPARVAAARAHADRVTRPLIENERLFRSF